MIGNAAARSREMIGGSKSGNSQFEPELSSGAVGCLRRLLSLIVVASPHKETAG